ncbi:O-antigen ligase family protein [Taibaiella soli]|uniref:O-antigen ligase-related domain-containing protein n=1 Tax=Taibaiella soli TaxID=1649169 RepID=A0A2W2C1U6_9BACT|nr:O-antigen ligase family protein [Taibaiella soli]PZF74033.1 hypothetical protein DN068_04890 [Taibaiella soli]
MSLKNSLAYIPLAFIFSIGKLYDDRLDFFGLPISEFFFGLYLLSLLIFCGKNGFRSFKDKESITYFILLSSVAIFGLMGNIKNGLNDTFDYSMDKMSALLLIIFLPSFVLRSFKYDNIDKFLRVVFFVSVFLFLGGIVALLRGGAGGGDEENSRLSVMGGGPIVFARWVSYSILYTLVFPFSQKRRLIILCVGTVLILLSGSRGPLFTLVPVLCTYYFIRYGFKKSIVILGVIGIAALVGLESFSENAAISRIMGGSDAASLTSGSSSESRQMKYVESQKIFSENILGIGFGNYARYAPSADHGADYPHNFIVEMFVEEGLVTGVLCIVFILVLFGRILRTRKMVRDPIYLFLMLITMYTFMNSLVSGDLGDLRFFLLYSLLLFTVGQLLKRAGRNTSPVQHQNVDIYSITELSQTI